MKWFGWVTAAVVVALTILKFPEEPDPSGAGPAESGIAEDAVAVAPVETRDGLTVIRDTGFDREYGAAASDAARDLALLHQILGDAMVLVKDHAAHPMAENADFVRFLSGKNPHRVAWIRPGHPSVNAEGELVDRWETPVFFHRESSSRTGLRSAGPDGKMWTEDDLVLENWLPD